MVQIDKDVPLPGAKDPTTKYPWRRLEVGDSFFAEGAASSSIASGASYASRRTGFKFTTRTVTENGVKGIRIWRVS